jgi:CelD/BcsL family acetyltransferase involved in cellulose biosynthesis
MAIRTRVLAGFDDPTFGPEQWEFLLRQGDTDVVYLTWLWQRCWWEAVGEGQLLLIVAERDGQVVALAPLAAANGMIFFVGMGEADYLDFIGDFGDPNVQDALLETARDCVPNFQGFKFYGLLDSSRTGQRLHEAAARLGLECFEEDQALPAPVLDLKAQATIAAVNKRSLRKRQRYFDQRGALTLRQWRDGEAIHPQLEEFFQQHVTRWGIISYDSEERSINLLDPVQRRFYERLTRAVVPADWLRFSRLEWAGRPIAFEFGY